MRQQGALALDAPGVAGQLAIAAHHPMAGNHHRKRIGGAGAGHNFPYLLRGNEFATMMIRGNRLGDVRESQYEAKTIELTPGDVLIWYTDGIVECENRSGEEWGEKRFRAAAKRAGGLDSSQMRDSIVAEALDFYGDVPRKDDITMVVGRIY